MTNTNCNPIAYHRSNITIARQMTNQIVRQPFIIYIWVHYRIVDGKPNNISVNRDHQVQVYLHMLQLNLRKNIVSR